LKKFQMAISPQRLTIYLYSAHDRAVMFAIAQLSCFLPYHSPPNLTMLAYPSNFPTMIVSLSKGTYY